MISEPLIFEWFQNPYMQAELYPYRNFPWNFGDQPQYYYPHNYGCQIRSKIQFFFIYIQCLYFHLTVPFLCYFNLFIQLLFIHLFQCWIQQLCLDSDFFL